MKLISNLKKDYLLSRWGGGGLREAKEKDKENNKEDKVQEN